MRLRNRKRFVEQEKDKVSGGLEQEVSDVDGEGLAHETEALNLAIENNEVEPVVQQQCDLDCDTSKNENVGLAENGSLRSDDNVQGVDVEMEMRKNYDSNDEMQSGGQVLRLMSKKADNNVSDDGEALNLTIENMEAEPIVQQTCDLDWDVSKSGNVGLTENGNKKSSFSCDDNIEGLDIEMEVMKDDDRNDKVQIGDRILHSLSKRVDNKILDDGEIDEMLVGKSRENEHDWFENNKVKGEKEKGGESVSSGYEKEIVQVQKEGNNRTELKRKRGRPPKLKVEEQDQLVGNMQQKYGKSPEMKMEEQEQFDGEKLQRKRGRPPKLKMDEQDQFVGEKMQRKRGRPPKVKMDEQDQLVGRKMQQKRGRPPKMKMEVQYQFLGEKMQRKRGRPPIMKMEEKDQFAGEKIQRKRGRPPKMKTAEQDQFVGQKMQRKRGRPPKVGLKNNLLKVSHIGKGKVGFQKGKKGLTVGDGGNMNPIDDVCSKRESPVKELKKKRFYHVKKSGSGNLLKTEKSEVASPLRSDSVNPLVTEKRGINKVKQLVRQHILELLLAAGWFVDYRPRNGKEYNDAVYVSPDGKTHWSITLAYKRLQEHSEAGDGEGKVYRPGFKFAPISKQEFNILTKVIIKKRKSKENKKQTGGNGIKKKVKRVKPGSFGGFSKSMKGKRKMKLSFVEEDNSDVTSHERFPVLVKDRKRQKTQYKKRGALLVRDAEKEIDSEIDGYVPYTGKRTLLTWMIDLGTVLQNGKIHYVNPRRKGTKLEGRITGDGIHCSCCNKVITILEFEAHAGSRLSDPLKNICIEGGTSLLQCLLDSWNKQDESERKGFHFIDTSSEDPNDDTCGVCGDGGDLICCDSCPSTFHQSCLNIKKFPSGDWHCIYCCCKFCGTVGGSTNERDGDNDLPVSALLTCLLCEQKYHRSCVVVNGIAADDSSVAFYCGNRCQELSDRLKMLLGVKHDIEDGFSWTFIRRSDVGSDASQIESQMVECNSKLAVALSVMDECFMPYIDHKSGINLIHSILYNCGSNFNRLNYSGFITAILERGDEVICVASIRIRGSQLAEMPFIGTRYMYRRQGMCRRLLRAIELALSSLNVELLVIPAISELRETWTSVFGFEPLGVTRKQIIKNLNLLVFPHVDMLQKEIKPRVADKNLISMEVSNSQLQKNQSTHEEANNCHKAGSFGSDFIVSAGSGIAALNALNMCRINDEYLSVKSGSSDDLSNNCSIHDITIETIHHDTSPKDVKCEAACHAVFDNLTVDDKTTCQIEETSNPGCFQSYPIGSKENGDCVPGEVNSETIKADGVNERGEAASAADRKSDLNDKPQMMQLPDLDLQVDQTARINAPSLCSSPNTASGMALHCASASCGNTEVIVLSNQAS